MRCLIIYQTTFGSNRKIAKLMEETVSQAGHEAELHDVKRVDAEEAAGADLYIFSAPTHIGSAPRRMRSFLRSLARVQREGPYGLLATRSTPDSEAVESMLQALSGGGMRCLSYMTVCLDGKDGLEQGWERKVSDFTEGLLSAAAAGRGALR